MNIIIEFIYLIAAILFIIGINQLSKVKTAPRGNRLSAVAMLLAVIATIVKIQLDNTSSINWVYIITGIVTGGLIGVVLSKKIKMTAIPQLVAIFNGLGGGASVLVALSYFLFNGVANSLDMVTVVLSIIIGTVTFTGSMVAFAKLQGLIKSQPILFKGRNILNVLLFIVVISLGVRAIIICQNISTAIIILLIMMGVAFILGILLVTPIGGADMPIVIALLNSYSGLAASMAGFMLGNLLLIISGALVGASGIILTKIMCKAMNRSLVNVLFGGFGQTKEDKKEKSEYINIKQASPEEVASILDAARSIIIVPGYGMAVAQAQNAVHDIMTTLEQRGIKVEFAIHPVAGRMPGHMNILLAEADVPYEKLKELELINSQFKQTDVAIVIGANDVVNPAAKDDKSSPIYGMPILNVYEAKTVIVIKRSLSPGFAGIKNELFEKNNTLMLFGDAKEMLLKLNQELNEL